MRLLSTRPTTPSWRQAKGRIAAFLRQAGRESGAAPGTARTGQARACPPSQAAWRIRPAPVTLPRMLFFLTSQPLWISGAIIIGGGTLLAMLGPALVRRFVALERLTINNEIAGFKFATVGVLYAVLLAFVIIVVWEKFTDAEVNVVREAGAAENIYRVSQDLGDTKGD